MSTPNLAVYESIRLYITESTFALEPTNARYQSLVIDRSNGSMSLTKSRGYRQNAISNEVFGLIGLVKFVAEPYLIVIRNRKFIGTVNGVKIFQLVRHEVHPLNPLAFDKLDPSQKLDEERFKTMVTSLLDSEPFYFSYGSDLTHSLQRAYTLKEQHKGKHLVDRADERFFWNKYMISSFTPEMYDFIVPITMGYMVVHQGVTVNNKSITYALLSRRNCRRAGTRFHVRGIDEDGNVANNVETEQIVVYEKSVFSFVQTRGSIPVFWEQIPSLDWTPTPTFSHTEEESFAAFKKHFEEQQEAYGKQLCINLINKSGVELKLANEYEKFSSQYDPEGKALRYIHFDFHHECRNMKFENVSKLVAQIRDHLQSSSYFYQEDQNVVSTQSGVCRTNCIDNLDRTNVVQTAIALDVLTEQLRRLNILAEGQDISVSEEFSTILKNVWADHADAVSMQYSGTGALKTDFTRTGKRTLSGMMQDGKNSATRFFLNNFYDGTRQDSYELFLGNYRPDAKSREINLSPLIKDNKVKKTLVKIFIAMLVILIATFIFVPTGESWTHKIMTFALWIVSLFAIYKVAKYIGKEMVDHPMFRKKKKNL